MQKPEAIPDIWDLCLPEAPQATKIGGGESKYETFVRS